MSHISASQFTTRFITLVLKGNGMPRKQEDRHILLLSAVLGLKAGREYTEKELNEVLRTWSTSFGDNVGLDHVSLRRLLVDERYLVRDAAGKTYIFKSEGIPCTVDPSIWSLNLLELIENAKKEQEEKRKLHQRDADQ